MTPFAVVFALAHVAHSFSIVTSVGLMCALLALSFFALGPNTRGRTLESLERRRAQRGIRAIRRGALKNGSR